MGKGVGGASWEKTHTNLGTERSTAMFTKASLIDLHTNAKYENNL